MTAQLGFSVTTGVSAALSTGCGDKFGRARGFGMLYPRQNPHRILANAWVERDSQKGIIIGHGRSLRTDVGTRARVEIEQLLGQHV